MTMAKKSTQFTWQPGDKPPEIESHTDAKLRLLEAYLDRYFDVVCALPQMDVLRIAFVDAFAGGGLYRRGETQRFGSPLVMIDAVRRAEARVNAGRRKALRIDARFFFIDEDPAATEYLRHSLETTGASEDFPDKISIQNAPASDALPSIIQKITDWSAAGRSIFFLDQCGFSDAPNWDVRLIYQSLPKSEVIVTYNYGAIYDYMNESAEYLTAMRPFELTSEHLRALLREREQRAGRYFAGRLLGRLLKTNVGSTFASRFFLRSEAAGRDMWFVHYSKVPRSRLVMSEAHWAVKNSSVTQGQAGLDMLGFRPNWEDQIDLDFGFDETDEGRIHAALVADLPHWLEQFEEGTAPTMDMLLTLTADNTAATEAQYHTALRDLETEDEIEVLTPSGSKKRPSARFRSGHRILLPRQSRFRF